MNVAQFTRGLYLRRAVAELVGPMGALHKGGAVFEGIVVGILPTGGCPGFVRKAALPRGGADPRLLVEGVGQSDPRAACGAQESAELGVLCGR